jgi:cyclohexanecarboxylate-CoA ligase
MTECGIASCCSPRLPDSVLATDGAPVPLTELRIVDGEGLVVTPGTVGELQVRGPGLFIGYYDRPDETLRSFTSDGWFHTGDLAAIDSEGYVTLQGRSKDIIIRGGENIPTVEVESLIFDHPDVINVAVVGYPDERLV